MPPSPPHASIQTHGPHPLLRLVNDDVAPTPRPVSPSAAQTRSPAPASHTQTGDPILSPLDPRWVLAVRTVAVLDGGPAAILTPDRRRGLLRLAETMGLRPFDAAVIIALVQDAARRGEDPLSTGLASSLASVHRPTKHRMDWADATLAILASILFAAALTLAAITWIVSV